MTRVQAISAAVVVAEVGALLCIVVLAAVWGFLAGFLACVVGLLVLSATGNVARLRRLRDAGQTR